MINKIWEDGTDTERNTKSCSRHKNISYSSELSIDRLLLNFNSVLNDSTVLKENVHYVFSFNQVDHNLLLTKLIVMPLKCILKNK